MYAWFLWNGLIFVIIITTIFSFLYAFTSPRIFEYKKSYIIPALFIIIIQLYVVLDSTLNNFFAAILRSFILISVLLFKDKIKIDILEYFIKAFTILLFISLFAWLLFLFGNSLPHRPTKFGDTYSFSNYYFFLFWDKNDIISFPRFSSVFLEPGQLGMITVFLICALKFDIKRKELWVFIVAILFSFSLAAYVLTIFELIGFVLIKSKKPILYLILFIAIMFAGYSFFNTLNKGNNAINNLIIERLYIKEGDLAGNNRFSTDMDIYFNRFLKSADVYTGINSNKYQKLNLGANAGFKVVLVQYGFIGTLIILGIYLSLAMTNRSKVSVLLFLVYLFCFIQNAYPLWESVLLIYITAMSQFKFDNLIEIKETLYKNNKF